MPRPDFAFESPEAIKYHIPFSWGTLRITHDACADYQLTSFSENTFDGDAPATKRGSPSIDATITVAGVSEIFSADQTIISSNLPVSGDSLPSFNMSIVDSKKGTLDIVTGFLESTQLALHKARANEEVSPDQGEIPTDEHSMSQFMSHALARRVGQLAGNGYFELLEANNTRRRRYEVIRSSTFLGGVIVGQAIPNLLSAPSVLSYGVLTLSSLIGINVHGRAVRQADSNLINRMTHAQIRAVEYANVVAQDIHATFCSKTFDNNMEERFRKS